MSNQSENPNPTSSSTKINLKISDNELFEVKEATRSPCFFISYCKRHLEVKANNKEMEQYEQELLRNVMPQELTELILAANYLNFKEALDFFCRAMANAIQNKSVEYVHKFFGLERDFEPGEEEKLRKEFA